MAKIEDYETEALDVPIREERIELDRALVKQGGFGEFVRVSWKYAKEAFDESDELVWEPHMDLICAHCEAVLRGDEGIEDLVINVPPGTTKSTLMSVLFPVYAWIVNPGLKMMFTSYDGDLTLDFAKRSLQLICSPWFQARWPHVSVRKGMNANMGVYVTTRGGKRISTMMGGKATGRHCHILVVDDPHKPDDLDGSADVVKAALELAWRRFINTFSQRLVGTGGRRICIMQRLHEQDIAGRMLALEGTVHLCLPMEFEPARACVTKWGKDWRTELGQLLCPKRKDATWLKRKKAEMTLREYAAQHQQRPSPAEGARFLRAWFQNRWLSLNVPLTKYTISVDANWKDRADSDYCAITVWAMNGPDFWMLDALKGQWSVGQACEEITRMKRKWPQISCILVEDKANGPAIVQTLKSKLAGITEVPPMGGKEARAEAVEPYLREGNCVFPGHAPWFEEFLEECASFPVGANDDWVDSMTQALLYLAGHHKYNRLFKRAMKNARAGKTFR